LTLVFSLAGTDRDFFPVLYQRKLMSSLSSSFFPICLSSRLCFLAPFFARAEQGELATASEIKQAFESRVGGEVEESTIYRLLHRHGWRKVVPRPRHPRASKEAQEQFKKTLRPRWKPPSLHAMLAINGRFC
jgi:hypothetical protein